MPGTVLGLLGWSTECGRSSSGVLRSTGKTTEDHRVSSSLKDWVLDGMGQGGSGGTVSLAASRWCVILGEVRGHCCGEKI